MPTPHDDAPDASTSTPRFRSLGWRTGDAMVSVLARTGIGPVHLLTTQGRRTGLAHTKPVVPVEHDARTWLVAPYGPVAWVHNARASGTVELRHGRTTRRFAVREAPAEEAGPVLQRYLSVATKVQARFPVTKDAPVEDFVAVADRYPVFELVPLDGRQ